MKRIRTIKAGTNNEKININDLLPEILLEIIFSLPKLKYPWQTLHFIFDELKMVCKLWNTLITSNEKIICSILKISPLHFASAMNREDEIVRLFLEENYMLRAPDAEGYSAACYATGNHAYRSMRRLKVAYALDTDCMGTERLQSFAPDDIHVTYLLKKSIKTYSFDDSRCIEKNIFDPSKKHLVEDFLTWDSVHKDIFIDSDILGHHVTLNKFNLLNNNPVNNLIIYIYKNRIIQKFINIDPYGTEKILQLCSEHNISLNTCDEQGNTALHKAVKQHHYIHIVKLLLECTNININIKNIDLQSPLNMAIYCNNIGAVKLLLQFYHNQKINFYNDVTLHWIFYRDMDDYLKLLIDNGFLPTIQDMMLGLYYIITRCTEKKCVRIIADILNITIPGIKGNDRIYLSKLFKDVSTKKLLMNYWEIFMEIIIQEDLRDDFESVLLLSSDKEKLINSIMRNSSRTPLCLTAMCDNIQLMQLLIKHGALSDFKDGHGYTAIHHAVQDSCIDSIKALIDAHANINIQIDYNEHSTDGYTPLHLAVLDNNINIVKLLLDNGADKTLITKSGLSAMDIAVKKNYVEIIAVL